ncbi:MAG TPA: peptidyl-tRNA hydrolase [Acidimicrobiales bacterium]|nr:peptidyl-tRNA hydrolase [Acidimicrobiales bacterium]
MPLVVRVERVAPPHHTDALEAVAKACLAVWHDERAAGEWAPAFEAWLAGRFRKVVRRARGAPWEAAGAVPGVLVRSGTAEVRAYPPVPNAELPRELAKLQVGGTDLVDPEPLGPPPPGAARLWLHPTLAMTTGKAAAQAGHASMLLWPALRSDAARAAWRAAGYPLAVRRASPERWAALAGIAPVEVADGGFTEVAPGSVTVRAEAPVDDDR